MAYAFGDLLGDIGKWYLLGLLIAGIISAYLSPEFVTRHLSGGVFPLLLMLAVSVPFYVCATASTPIAAALVLKGLSPGAALIFLLAGPATNAASLTVIFRILGRKSALIYVGAIVGTALLLGIATDWIYAWAAVDVSGWMASAHHEMMAAIEFVCAVVLLLLIVKAVLPASFRLNRNEKISAQCHCCEK